MKLTDFVLMQEAVAPSSLALDFDNVGLLIGTEREIRKVLVALDCTVPVAMEAVRTGSDLVLTHHPLFFHAVKSILPDDPDTAAAYLLIRNGIGLYSAHTNLDAVSGGVNDALADALGASKVSCFTEDGIGRVASFSPAITLKDLLAVCTKALGAHARFSGDPKMVINKAWIVSGAGGDSVRTAAQAGCDILITGEMKHHEALECLNLGMPYIECGHYESEAVVLKKWISRLQSFQNDVEYNLSISEKPPFSVYEEEATCPDRN